MATSVYIKWFRDLTERFYPWPKNKRLEKKIASTIEERKSIVGKTNKPRQDVFEDE